MAGNISDQTLAAALVSLAKKYQPKVTTSGDRITIKFHDGRQFVISKSSQTTRSNSVRNR